MPYDAKVFAESAAAFRACADRYRPDAWDFKLGYPVESIPGAGGCEICFAVASHVANARNFGELLGRAGATAIARLSPGATSGSETLSAATESLAAAVAEEIISLGVVAYDRVDAGGAQLPRGCFAIPIAANQRDEVFMISRKLNTLREVKEKLGIDAGHPVHLGLSLSRAVVIDICAETDDVPQDVRQEYAQALWKLSERGALVKNAATPDEWPGHSLKLWIHPNGNVSPGHSRLVDGLARFSLPINDHDEGAAPLTCFAEDPSVSNLLSLSYALESVLALPLNKWSRWLN